MGSRAIGARFGTVTAMFLLCRQPVRIAGSYRNRRHPLGDRVQGRPRLRPTDAETTVASEFATE